MKHPKSADVYKVAETLEKVLPDITTERHLNMKEWRVNNYEHQCGTTHCHGGWYAIASKLHENAMVDYSNGAKQMAEDLGFKNGYELQVWASKNPTIWGNEDGEYMFNSFGTIAFFNPTKRPKGAKTIKDIVDHWKEVAGRLEEMENKRKNKKSPAYKNITKELAVLPVEETSDKIISKEIIVQ